MAIAGDLDRERRLTWWGVLDQQREQKAHVHGDLHVQLVEGSSCRELDSDFATNFI
jgi:hypothetical protein